MADSIYAVLDGMMEDASVDMGRSLQAGSALSLLLSRNFICLGVCGLASFVTLFLFFRRYRSSTAPQPSRSQPRSQPPFQELMNLGELENSATANGDTRARPVAPQGRWYCSWQLIAFLGFVLLSSFFARLALADFTTSKSSGTTSSYKEQGTTSSWEDVFEPKFGHKCGVEDFSVDPPTNPETPTQGFPPFLACNSTRLEPVGCGFRKKWKIYKYWSVYKVAYYVDSEDVGKVGSKVEMCNKGNVGWYIEIVAGSSAIGKVPGGVVELLGGVVKSKPWEKKPETVLASMKALWTVSTNMVIKIVAPPGGKLQYLRADNRDTAANGSFFEVPNENTVEDDEAVLAALCEGYLGKSSELKDLNADVDNTLKKVKN